jgi:hypothetical protein
MNLPTQLPPKNLNSHPAKSKQGLSVPLILSIGFHSFIVLLIGGAVLVPGIIPKSPFVGEMVVPSSLSASEDEMPEFLVEEAGPEMPETEVMPELAASAPTEQTFDVISVSVPTPTFSLPVGSGVVGIGDTAFGTGSSPTGAASLPRTGGVLRDYFGSGQAQAGDLEGTFYDLKQNRDGTPRSWTLEDYHRIVADFASNRIRKTVVEPFFQSTDKLYSQQFFLPDMPASLGPKFFGLEGKVEPMGWIIHYEGKAIAPFSGRFRFVGRAGEVLMVLWNNRLVLDGCHSAMRNSKVPSSKWKAAEAPGRYLLFNTNRWTSETLVFGDWINVRAGEEVQVDVVIGERGGGSFYCFLMWEGPNAKGQLDPATNMMGYPIWTTSFGEAAKPEYVPGVQGPPVAPLKE